MKSILLLLFCFCIARLHSQNLVPNPSFEDTVACPDFPLPNIGSAQYWSSYGNTPDYFNGCANSQQQVFGVPSNFAGEQNAKLGNAYAGLVSWYVNGGVPYREFIGVKLTESLIIGTQYFVSCFVANGDTTGEGPSSTNNIGFRFSTIEYYDSIGKMAPIDNFSHIHEDSIISDKINWTRVAGSFVADSSYSYLIIGNFYDDNHTLIDTVGQPDATGAYYYVDAVCVSIDSIYDSNWTNIFEQEMTDYYKLFPNPALTYMNLLNKGRETEMIIYDSTGKQIKKQWIRPGSNRIDISSFTAGMYIIAIDKNFYYKFIVQ